ncbi:hypothetical protein [Chitinibacter sp. S2-10]|uniref:hypothetical protein n=1 Tax=Chitinibacter sp. S2-10 TaxID=3373597 RepID=UPI003977C544
MSLLTLAFVSLTISFICSRSIFPQVNAPLLAEAAGIAAIPLMLLAVIKLAND